MAQEKRFENRIKKLLDESGAYHVKYFGCGFTQAGVPDLLACIQGRFVGIEVKADNGRPSPLQIHNLKQIQASGGIGVLVYPKDYEALKRLIQTLLSCENDEKIHLVLSQFTHKFD